jgi:WD40 repeat protein
MRAAFWLIASMCLPGIVQAQAVFAKPAKSISLSGLPCDIRLSGDGTRLAVATDNSCAYLYDFPEGNLLFEVKPDAFKGVEAPTFSVGRVLLSNDGKWFGVALKNNPTFQIYNAETKKRVHQVKNYLGEYGSLRFNPAGNLLYIVQRDREYPGVFAYDLAQKTRTFRFGVHVFDYAIDHDSRVLHALEIERQSGSNIQATGSGTSVSTYGFTTRQYVREDLKTKKRSVIAALDAGTQVISEDAWGNKISFNDRIALSPDRTSLLITNKIFNLKDGRSSEAFHQNSYGGVSFTPDSTFLACSNRSVVDLIEVANGSTRAIAARLKAGDKQDRAYSHIPPAISPDGRFLCAPGPDASLQIWDLKEILKK